MSSTTIDHRGRRFYLRGAPFAVKGVLRAAGCTWDPEQKAWWTGKRDVAEELLERVNAASATDSGADRKSETVGKHDTVLQGRATYKGKSYYLLVEGTKDGRRYAKLCSRDGSLVFWVNDFTQFEITARYQKPKSITELSAFAARRKREAETGECECWCHSPLKCSCSYSAACDIHFDGCASCGCEQL